MPNQKDPILVAKGRIGAAMLHARYDGRALTVAARAAADGRFLGQARADAAQRGESLSEAELERRAKYLRKAFYARMQYASVVARRRTNKKKAADGSCLPAAMEEASPSGAPAR